MISRFITDNGMNSPSLPALQSYLELYNETVEYRVGRQEDPLVPHPRKHVVVAVDGSMDAPLLASWRAAILTTFKVLRIKGCAGNQSKR